MEDKLGQFMTRANDKLLKDDAKIEEGLRRVARQSAQAEIGKRPEVTVVISRLTE
jgi:ribonuclease J